MKDKGRITEWYMSGKPEEFVCANTLFQLSEPKHKKLRRGLISAADPFGCFFHSCVVYCW